MRLNKVIIQLFTEKYQIKTEQALPMVRGRNMKDTYT